MSANRKYRQFSDALAMISDGKLNDEAGRELNAAVAAVEATQKPATVTITLKIAMAGKNSEMVKIDPTVVSKLPQVERSSSLFFIDEDHNISMDKPRLNKGPSVVEEVGPRRQAVGS